MASAGHGNIVSMARILTPQWCLLNTATVCLRRKCRRQNGVCWTRQHGVSGTHVDDHMSAEQGTMVSAAHNWTAKRCVCWTQQHSVCGTHLGAANWCLLDRTTWCLRHTFGRSCRVCWTRQHGVCDTQLVCHMVSAGHGIMVFAAHMCAARWCPPSTAR